MTNNDFDKIIYDSFDNLDTPQSYFEDKRKQSEIVPQEFAAGLRKSFERLRLPFVTASAKTLTLQNRIKRRLGNNISGHLFDMMEPKFNDYMIYLGTPSPPQQIELPDQETIGKGNKTKRYIIKNDDLIQQVYNICKIAFDCDYLTFRESIETANFHLLNIKKQNRVQDLTFRLSGIMDAEWYSDVCKIMNWKKGTCSGLGQKVENLGETKQLDKKLPRPKK